MPLDEAFEYYGTDRGGKLGHYVNRFATTSREHTLVYDAQSAATQIDAPTQTFLDVLPGAIAKFNVAAENTFLPGAPQTQVFTLTIDVVGDQVTVLDQRQVLIIVPAEFNAPQ